MNPKLDLLFSRRSIRSFRNADVSPETVHDILEAAMAAPSACAKDPWEFIVIRDKGMLKAVAEGLPNGKFLPDGQVGIVVCGDLDKAHGNELSYMLQDCSAAIENLLLAASALGVGTCWLGVHPRQDRVEHISKLLNLPENVLPICAIAMGYPETDITARTRFRNSAVHKETW